MKMYDFGVILLISVLAACVVGGIGSYYVWGPDNPVEEIAEEVIEKETGLKIDLSPKHENVDANKATIAWGLVLACGGCGEEEQ